MSWRLARPCLAMACALMVGACGVGVEQQARPLPTSLATGLLPATPTAPAEQIGPDHERLFLSRDNKLVPVVRRVRVGTPAVALSDLLAGPTQQETELGLTSALSPGLRARVRLDGKVAVVSLDSELTSAGRSDEVLALAQVVATLDANAAVDAVRFDVRGTPLAVPRGDGSLTQGAVTTRDYRDLLVGTTSPGAGSATG